MNHFNVKWEVSALLYSVWNYDAPLFKILLSLISVLSTYNISIYIQWSELSFLFQWKINKLNVWLIVMCRHYDWKIKPQIIYAEIAESSWEHDTCIVIYLSGCSSGGPLASTALCAFTVYTANFTYNSSVAPSIFILNRYYTNWLFCLVQKHVIPSVNWDNQKYIYIIVATNNY